MLPETMNCVEISRPGPPEVLIAATRPLPKPGPGEVLIKVAAGGINRPDALQRQGAYPAPPGASDLPGLEVAGTIAALGQGVTAPEVGAEVCALVPGGGYAEYCTTDARLCMPVPRGFDMVRAAALPETFFTVWHNVFERGQLRAGESFLVHGGASGIGTTAIQLAKAFGAKVFATASGAVKCKACTDLGADHAIDYATQDFVEVVKTVTGGKGVDVILDMVGGDYIPRNIRCLAADGRLVSIAFMRGSSAEVNLMPVMLKRLTLTGSTLRPQSNNRKAVMAAGLLEKVWPLLSEGRVAPVVHATFPLAQASEAHRLMESNAHIGKIVLTV
jgi:NADPH2:quinone reductase